MPLSGIVVGPGPSVGRIGRIGRRGISSNPMTDEIACLLVVERDGLINKNGRPNKSV